NHDVSESVLFAVLSPEMQYLVSHEPFEGVGDGALAGGVFSENREAPMSVGKVDRYGEPDPTEAGNLKSSEFYHARLPCVCVRVAGGGESWSACPPRRGLVQPQVSARPDGRPQRFL